MLGNSEIVTRVREQDHTLSKFLLLKNFTCMKYVKIQCKTPEIPQTRNFLLATPLATTQRQPKQVFE